MKEKYVELGEIAYEPIEQSGPSDGGKFFYVDIGSIDRETKEIVSAKILHSLEAPSRAKQKLKTGDVLISMTRPNLNAVTIIPPKLDEAIGSTGFHILRSKWVEQKFLFYLVQSHNFIEEMCRHVQGALYPAVRPSDISSFKFLLPSSFTQIRIVKKLEELLSDLDAGVAELKAAQKKLTQYRQSLLKAAVEGALTAEWRAECARHGEPLETGAQLLERILVERRRRWEEKQLAKFKEQGKAPHKDWRDKYPEPVKPNTANLPELPEGWGWATIDQLALEIKYGSSAKTSVESGSIPVLRMGNIQDGELHTQDLKFLSADHDEFPSLILQDGDLIFNRTNSPELVGKTVIYRSQITPCSYASYLIAVRFAPFFFPEFASAYINSIYGRLWVKSVVTQQVGQANVNGSKLAALAIPLPPYQEQIEIVRLLLEQRRSSFEQSKAIEYSLKQSSAQRQNILKAAFSGQLVPQDPSDEPASVLLERIRAERAARGESVGRRRGRKAREDAA